MPVTLFYAPFRYIFGRDVFISYSRADAAKYAQKIAYDVRALAEKEKKSKPSFYLDRWNAPSAGVRPDELPASLIRQLMWCNTLVVICSENSIKQESFVRKEIQHFPKSRSDRRVIPISIERIFFEIREQEPWNQIIGALPELESLEALEKGQPSEEIVQRIYEVARTNTQDRRLNKASILALALIIISVAALAGTLWYSSTTIQAANLKASEAQTAANDAGSKRETAESAANTAKTEANKANQSAANAEAREIKANHKAEAATNVAANKTKLAEEKTKIAAEQTTIAAEQTTIAAAETKKAAEQTEKADQAEKREGVANKKATEEELKARTSLAENYYKQAQVESQTDAVQGLLWAQKALETTPSNSPNFEIYKFLTLNLTRYVPFSIANISGPAGLHRLSPQQDKVLVASEETIYVLDLKTGKRFPSPIKQSGILSPDGIFSPDGKRIAFWFRDRTADKFEVKVWDIETGALRTNHVSGNIKASSRISFSADSNTIIFNSETGRDQTGRKVTIRILAWRIGEPQWTDLGESVIPENLRFGNEYATYRDSFPISKNPKHNRIITYRQAGDNVIATVKDLLDKEKETQITLPANTYYVNFTPNAEKVIFLSRPISEDVAIDNEKVKLISGIPADVDGWYFKYVSYWDIKNERFTETKFLFADTANTVPDGSKLAFDLADMNAAGNKIILTNRKGVRLIDTKGNYKAVDMLFGEETVESEAILSKDEKYIISKRSSSGLEKREEIEIWDAGSGKRVRDPIVIPFSEGAFDISHAENIFTTTYTSGRTTVEDFLYSIPENILPIDKFSVEKNKEWSNIRFSTDFNFMLAVETPQIDGLDDDQEDQNDVIKILNLRNTGTVIKDDSAEWLAAVDFHPTNKERYLRLTNEEAVRAPNYLVTVRSLEDNSIIKDFQNITGQFSEAKFSRDGSSIITLEGPNTPKDGSGSRFFTVKRWNADTGAFIDAGNFALKGEIFNSNYAYGVHLTLFGEYLIFNEQKCDQFDKHCRIFNVANTASDNDLIQLQFASNESATKARAIITQAFKLRIENNDLLADFKDGLSIRISSANGGRSSVIQSTGSKFSSVFSSIITAENIRLSPDGKLLLTRSSGKKLQLWETTTGLALTKPVYFDDVVEAFEFTPEGEDIFIATVKGAVQKIHIGNLRVLPAWMKGMSEVLTGMRLTENLVFELIPQEENVILRRHFLETLQTAASCGDKDALFVLGNWQPDQLPTTIDQKNCAALGSSQNIIREK